MEEKETHVDTLLKICQDLTAEHIIKVCENLDFQDELTKRCKGEVNYIRYKNNYYRLKPTIRKANDIILNNRKKLDIQEYKKGAGAFTSNDFVKFYDEKFSNDTIIQRVRKGDEVDFESIKYFAENYFGKEYRKENNELKELGKKAYNNFQNFGDMILSDLYNFTLQNHKWQNGWNIKNQFWMELKDEDYKDYPFSISLFCDESCDFIITLELKTDEKNKATQEQINRFNALKQKNIFGFEHIDTENRIFCKKLTEPYISKRTDEIVDEAVNLIKELELFYESIFKGEKNMPKQPLNQILYGPPGTGKTYNTVIKAMEIIDEEQYTDNKGNLLEGYDYHDLKEHFDAYKEQGQIEFVTFHQSYSYEEFVEGIKPVTDEDDWTNPTDKLLYAGNEGIFKRICKKAEDSYVQDANNSYGLNKNPKIWKVSLKSTGDNDIRIDCMKNNRIRIGFDKYGEFISDETIFDEAGVRVVPAFINKMEIGDIVLSCYTEKTIDAIGVITSEYKWNNDFDEYKRYREVKWLAKDLNQDIVNINKGKKFTLSTIYQLKNIAIKDVLDMVNKPQHQKEYKRNYKPHVLIIDEINRGNISKIFGELITLIESDKRKNVTGDDREYHTLEVTLPYSKDPFYVPNNLYIIGTMNTSDRSIASIDIALRRRFKFVEMMPKPELFENVKIQEFDGKTLKDLLETLNQRISILLDRDHQIGHSYFIKFQSNEKIEISINALKDIWFDEIMPLLNEYFYGDWEKLQAILGKAKEDNSFIIDNTPKDENAKSKMNSLFAFDYKDYDCDNLYDFAKNTENFVFEEAMKNAFGELYKVEKTDTTQNEKEDKKEE